MKQKTIKSIQNLCTSLPEERCFACYDKKTNVIIAGNHYAAAIFTDITAEDRNTLENLPEFGKKSVTLNNFIDNFENHYREYYDDNKCFAFTIKDAQQEVKRLKSGRRGKSYGINKPKEMYVDFLVEDYGVVYNIELLADVAACLEGRYEYELTLAAAFPRNRKDPIIIYGKYGYGIVMPCMASDNIRKSEWRNNV